AVQWVGEEKLAERRGDLERTLEAGSVSGPIFEAYLAAASLLRGEAPDARDMVSRDESLLALARDASRPASVRALALRGVSPAHPGLDEVALRGFLDEAEPALRLEAVRSLRESPVQAARELLARLARDASAPAELRREAAAGLSRHLPGSTADLLALLDGAQDPLVRREAERALRLGAESGSPRRVDVPGDRERLLEGGDPREGEILFFYPRSARCSGCHAVRGRGGVAGPDLSAAGWRPREKLLESLLEPSREIAPQYATWVLMTPEGPRSGTVLGEDPDGAVRLGTGTSIVERVPREAVLSRSLAEASLMPEGIASLLTLEELRHLLAFLEAQR
ncbi:MAG: hypothetical protein HY721_13895, partial [Planctomycetes bacterium]|nr:hypothetical protein [Planctomycetota bacterium]